MTLSEQIVTLGLCLLGTALTRFLPFGVFSERRETPDFIKYIGKYLPSAVFGMLIIYALKDVSIISGSHGLPELIAIVITAALYVWKRQMILSISAGTISYMLLIHFVFV